MIMMTNMGKFVHHDVVHRLGGILHQPPRKAQPVLTAATAETLLRTRDAHARRDKPHHVAVIRHPLWDDIGGEGAQVRLFLRRYLPRNRRRGALTLRDEMPRDPILARRNNALDLPFRATQRCAHHHPQIGSDLQPQRATRRAYQFIIFYIVQSFSASCLQAMDECDKMS